MGKLFKPTKNHPEVRHMVIAEYLSDFYLLDELYVGVLET